MFMLRTTVILLRPPVTRSHVATLRDVKPACNDSNVCPCDCVGMSLERKRFPSRLCCRHIRKRTRNVFVIGNVACRCRPDQFSRSCVLCCLWISFSQLIFCRYVSRSRAQISTCIYPKSFTFARNKIEVIRAANRKSNSNSWISTISINKAKDINVMI